MTRRLLPLALLVLLPACRLQRPEAPAIYAPWEEGRTLAYEDPSLPISAAQRESRFQVRVAQGLMDPTKPGLIRLTHASLQSPPTSYLLRVAEGGVELLAEDGKVLSVRLPKGFPERTRQWEDPALGLRCQVIGPGTWENPAGVKGVQDPIGVWVEITSPRGKARGLYVRGLGEVEQRLWKENRWVAVNRLVDMGFTDDTPARKP